MEKECDYKERKKLEIREDLRKTQRKILVSEIFNTILNSSPNWTLKIIVQIMVM